MKANVGFDVAVSSGPCFASRKRRNDNRHHDRRDKRDDQRTKEAKRGAQPADRLGDDPPRDDGEETCGRDQLGRTDVSSMDRPY